MAVSERSAIRLVGKDEDPALIASRAVLDFLFDPVERRTFSVRYWNGVVDIPTGPPYKPLRFTLVLNSPSALRRIFWPPSELGIAEAYLRNDYDVEGDLEYATALSDRIHSHLNSPRDVVRLLSLLRQLPNGGSNGILPALHQRKSSNGTVHTLKRDRDAVRSHYDVSNEFYQLWLDPRMVYSCAYFLTGDETIETAQEQKLDLICRKLQLKPGDRLLDVGCGWGALIRYAAQRYGVTALGITLSERQAQYASQKIYDEGLSERVRVELRDYRELDETDTFNKIVSVGMVEHVGRAKLPEYFARLYKALIPGGLFLNHGIVAAPEHHHVTMLERIGRRFWHEGEFIDKYVFPDGELVPLASMISPGEATGFEARDVESLREHYMRTLRLWVSALEQAKRTAVDLVGEETYRVWRLYMSASAHAFSIGRISIAQTLFAKCDAAGRVGLPLTRASW